MSESNYYSSDSDNEEVELFSYDDVTDNSEGLKYRSIAVHSRPAAIVSTPTMDMNYSSKSLLNVKVATGSFYSACPSIPFGMAKDHFIMIRPTYTAVRESVDSFLASQTCFDFSFLEDEFMWKGKYLSGSSCFELEVNLYHDKAVNTYTVAVRKVSCDSAINACFGAFFIAMRAALCNDTTSLLATPARKPFCIPKGCSYGVKVSDAEFLQGVQCIFAMAAISMEARVQCVKMLCDLAQKDAHFLELPAFRPQCVQLLEELVADESDDVRQYAVMAVAAFAELASYKDAFLESSVLPALFCLVENCQYETAQMRRTAAAVLALLCRTHPYTMREGLQRQDAFCVVDWMQRVSLLEDARTRESALVVKAFLEDVSLPSASRIGAIDAGMECVYAQN